MSAILTKWRPLVAVSLAAMLMLLGVTMASVALPEIQRDLGASFDDLRWVIDAYALTLAATMLIAGSLADRFGRLRMFRIGLVLFAAASLAGGFASSAIVLDILRGLQGIGGAAMFATSLALISASYSGRDRHMAFGFWGGMTAGAMAIGPLVGGGLVGAFGWEATLFVNVPVVAVIWLLVARGAPESRDPDAAGMPDLAGLVAVAGSMTLLILALFRGDEWGWGSVATISAFIGAGALLAAFIAIEPRRVRPLLDLRLFRKPSISGASIGVAAISFSVFAIFTFLTLYIQSTLGHTPAGTGLRIFALTISSFIAALLAARLADRIRLQAQLAIGLALVGVGTLLWLAQVNATSEWEALIPGGVLLGAGTGIGLFAGSNVALAAAPRAQSGMAAGLNSTSRLFGLAVGVAALGTLLESRVSTRLSELLPGLDSSELVDLAATGNVELAAATVPPALQADVAVAAQTAFVSGLEIAFVVAAAVAFAGAVAALALVRGTDLEFDRQPDASEASDWSDETAAPVAAARPT